MCIRDRVSTQSTGTPLIATMRFVLYYHPIPFRAQFMRVILEYTGTCYSEELPYELKLADPADPNTTAHFMAPPLLWDKEADLYISQTPAIMSYLAGTLGLVPESLTDSSMALKVLCDCNDLLNEITCGCGANMWDLESWDRFHTGRLVRWLQILEATGTKHGLTSDDKFMLGTPTASLADMAVFATLPLMERCLPELTASLREHAPNLMGLCDRLEGNKGLCGLMSRQPTDVYCGGQIEKSLRAVLAGGEADPSPDPEAESLFIDSD
eukprot:TRINITY_DN60126_c0_g1_i1.p1 TRINITY_DN60126_c0_g1~~TRINITY_DN60126_c0_g1_i1.p1  ORF type:complete len:268 (+),score=71.95 TRINITY_DN60126_c0_g1_i1:172-975(+)